MLITELDGELSVDESGINRRISLDIAWVLDVLEDLVDLPNEMVIEVHEDFNADIAQITYHPEITLVEPSALREAVDINGLFAHFRVLTLAYQLATHLQMLHERGITQLLIHPQRICLHQHKFILLPSIAGVLPPFPTLIKADLAGWFHYVAPEVIRTRGINIDLLEQGDVYSLGQTLRTLLTDVNPHIEGYEGLTQLVENPRTLSPMQLPDNLVEFGQLLDEMCSWQIAQRPYLHQVVERLATMQDKLGSFDTYLLRLLQTLQHETVQTALDEIARHLDNPLMGLSQSDYYYYRAQSEITAITDDIEAVGRVDEVISLLRQAEQANPQNIRVLESLGDVYQLHTTHPNHLQLATQAYDASLYLGGHNPEIFAKWLVVFRQWDAMRFLQTTLQMRMQNHSVPRILFHERVKAFLDINQPQNAWYETVVAFEIFGYDDTLYQQALDIARKNFSGPSMIAMRTKYENQNDDKTWPYASLSIMWAANGNKPEAEKYLKLAKQAALNIQNHDQQGE